MHKFLTRNSLSIGSLLLFLSAFVVFFAMPNVQADNEATTPLQVEPQTNDVKFQQAGSNFFDFKLAATDKMEQTVAVKVTNPSQKQVKVKTSLNKATTSPTAEVIYNQNGEKSAVKSLFKTNDLFTLANPADGEFELNPGESKDIQVKIKTPETATYTSFSGEILAGINFNEPDEKNDDVSVPLAIKKGKGTDPNIRMGKIETASKYDTNIINALVSNTHPSLLKNTDFKADIVKKGTNDVVASFTRTNGEIAPNSKFNFGIPWNTKRVIPGVYTIKLKINSSDPQFGSKGRTWFFEKDFIVTVFDAVKANLAVTHSIPWLFMLIVIVLLAVFSSLIYGFIKIRKAK
ncbi:DUF3324 domain-containing protein [Fructilactobacillus vespulae]|uniref:WxL protein host-binding domain-containing protein n=1 Tax=Fructilactobacillus vespulae TaxID=1249630 RepID=UPI0039B399F3